MATASSLPPGFGRLVTGSLPAHHISQKNKPKHASVTKKVSWATGDRLCQVRLFAAEDSPGQLSSSRQDLLQAKRTRFMHAINPIASNDIPPGFGPVALKSFKPAAAAIMQQVVWRAPEVFKLDPTWLVMAGGASQEVAIQKQREVRVLEAVYPRPSAVPESPAEPLESQLLYDDTKTLNIPVVPVEDDDSPDRDDGPLVVAGLQDALDNVALPGEEALSPPGFGIPSKLFKSRDWFPECPQNSGSLRDLNGRPSSTSLVTPAPTSQNIPHSNPSNIQTRPKLSNGGSILTVPPTRTETEPDIAAAAAAAYAALTQSNDETIDRDLLIQFLTNPSMLQNLSNKSGTSAPTPHIMQMQTLSRVLDQRLFKSVEQHAALGVNGQPWTPPLSTFSGRHREQEVSQSTRDNGPNPGPRKSETPGVVGGPLTATGFERPPGFGPPPTANGLSNFPGAFDGGPLHPSLRAPTGPPLQMPQSGQGYRPPSRLTNMPPLASSSIALSLPATQPAASGSGRPLSQQDEQYYKDLISQHGTKSEEDRWDIVGSLEMGNSYSASALPRATSSSGRTERAERVDSGQRWLGREDMDLSGSSIRQSEGAGSIESRSGQMRGKIRKACIYFSTPRGCRNGSNCQFLHESNNSERSKRPKVDGEDSSKGSR